MRMLFTINYWRKNEGNSCFEQTVPLARALIDGGHEVIYAVPVPFVPTVLKLDLKAVPAGMSEEFTSIQKRLNISHLPPAERSSRYFQDILGGVCAQRMAADIMSLAYKWKPDLIIREDTELGGCLAAEALGVPHASVKVTGMRPPDLLYDKAGKGTDVLNERRAELGLGPDPNMVMPHRYLQLLPMPPRLYGVEKSLTMHAVRPLLFDRFKDETLCDWVGSLPYHVTIYATSGNTFQRDPDILRTVVKGLRDEPVNLIVTVGRDADPASLGHQPPNVRVEHWVPNSLLLPLCDLVVCHAGPATIMGALSHGKPLVLVPFFSDHPWNAERCAVTHVGRVVGERGRTPETIREAVYNVLHDLSYREHAEFLRDEIAALPGIDHAIALLEHLAIERRPLLS